MPSNRSTSETLTEIIGVAVEYDLHREPNRFIHFLDLYSTYLGLFRPDGNERNGTVATFYEFVGNQSLLDLAASMTTFETGERLDAPIAIKLDNKLDTKGGNSLSIV